METSIPTYAADGRRLRNYSQDAIERLLALSLVVVRRNARGAIRVAQFRGIAGANPLRRSAHCGTKYSFLVQRGDARVWEHKRLLQRQDVEVLMGQVVENEEDLERYLQGVFRAVPLSCLKTEALEARPAKVVSIAEFAHRRKRGGHAKRTEQPARPIEFDSERRAA